MELHWELYPQYYSTQTLLSELEDPFYDHLDDVPNKDIIDVGCGQRSLILKYAPLGSRCTAIDVNKEQLNALKNRLESLSVDAAQRVDLISGVFPIVRPGRVDHGLAIISDIFHFMDESEQREALDVVKRFLSPRALLYIKAHSTKHIASSGIDSRIKRCLSMPGMQELADTSGFDCLRIEEVDERRTANDESFIRAWRRRVMEETDGSPSQVEEEIEDYLALGPLITTWGLFRNRS